MLVNNFGDFKTRTTHDIQKICLWQTASDSARLQLTLPSSGRILIHHIQDHRSGIFFK
jgi:hypothetical protein